MPIVDLLPDPMPLALHLGTIGAIAAAATLCTRGLRRPELGHVLWIVVLIALLGPPMIEVPLLPARIGPDTVRVVPRPSPLLPGDGDPASGASGSARPSGTAVIAGPLAHGTDASSTAAGAAIRNDVPPAGLPWPWILAAAWAAGALVVAGRAARSIVGVGRLLERSSVDDASLHGEIEAEIHRLARSLGPADARRRRVRVVDAAIAPSVWPTVRPGRGPTIVLPRALVETLDPAALRAVLLHELVHVQRRDHWVRVLELAVACVHWWNPLAWLARRELRLAEEACCDRRVLAIGTAAATYAEALLAAIDVLRQPVRALPPVATGATAASQLTRRLTMIMLDHTSRPLSPTARWLVALAGLVLATFLPVHGAPAPVDGPTPPPPPPLELEPEEAARASSEPPVTDAERVLMEVVLRLIEAGDLDEAERLLLDAADQGDGSATIELTLGNIAFRRGELDAAAERYEAAIERWPGFGRAVRNLAMVRLRQGDHVAAADLQRRVVEHRPDDATAHGLLGFALASLERHDGALASYRTAHALDPDTVDWVVGAVGSAIELDRLDEATGMLAAALDWSPDLDIDPSVGRAIVARLEQREDSDVGAALLVLGRLHERAGDDEAARAAWERASAYRDHRAEALLRSARLMTRQGRWIEAEPLLLRVFELDDDHMVRQEVNGLLRRIQTRKRIERGEHAWPELEPVKDDQRPGIEVRIWSEEHVSFLAHGGTSVADLGPLVRDALRDGPEPIVIRTMADVPAGVLARVIDELKVAGATDVSIETRDEVRKDVHEPAAWYHVPNARPPAELAGRNAARATLLVWIDAEGRVSNVRIVTCTDHDFDASIRDAVRRWRFHPATRDGEPVAWGPMHVVMHVQAPDPAVERDVEGDRR